MAVLRRRRQPGLGREGSSAEEQHVPDTASHSRMVGLEPGQRGEAENEAEQ